MKVFKLNRPATELLLRYYSNTVLQCIHRSIAIAEWHKMALFQRTRELMPGPPETLPVNEVKLERLLGAFDMFFLRDQPGDIDDVSCTLPQRGGN